MCRILFLKWTNKNKALEYIDAFHSAWFNDPHLEIWMKEIWWKYKINQHIHGWWYLLVTENNIKTYLNGQAFFDDTNWFDNLKKQVEKIEWNFLLMAELRLTDEGYVSALNSHPFFFSSDNWYEWWFFYNWLIDRDKLANLEWLKIENFKKKNWTTIMWHCISKSLESWNDIKKALLCPQKALKSWYNLMSFVNDNSWEYRAFINAYSKEELLKNSNYKEFIKIIKKEEKDLFFAWSNAISVYRKDNYEVMENWEFLEFKIDWIKEFYFNAWENWIDKMKL